MLNRKVQEIAFGFPDDFPLSDEVLNRFLEGEGQWPDGIEIPDELSEEGRQLIAGLVDSAPISGFKDPRTALTWPFWDQILREFSTVRVVVIPLLRSPHEIAMSLCNRSNGALGYWTCLDITKVHLKQMLAIVKNAAQVSRSIEFGGGAFPEHLDEVVRFCGLHWDTSIASRVFDQSCVHHEPAAVSHSAQLLYEEMGGRRTIRSAEKENGWLVARDARKCETLTRRFAWQAIDTQKRSDTQLETIRNQASSQAQQLSEIHDLLAKTQQQLFLAQAELVEAKQQVVQTSQDLRSTQQDLTNTQQELTGTQQELTSTQQELTSTQQELTSTHQELSRTQQELARTHQELSRTQREQFLIQCELSDSRHQLAGALSEISRSRASEHAASEECLRLRSQRDRFESHPVMGSLLRTRRRVKSFFGQPAIKSEAGRGGS
jgi:hypothetical protein